MTFPKKWLGRNEDCYKLYSIITMNPLENFGLNFTWKFGKLEFKKEKETNNENLNPPSEQ